VVVGLAKDGPAQKADLRTGDVLLSVAGVAIFFALSALSHFALRRWHESAVKREL